MTNPPQSRPATEDSEAGAGKSLEKADLSVSSTRFEWVLDGETELFPLSWIPIQTAKAIHLTSGRTSPTTLEGGAETWVVGLTRLCGGEGEESHQELSESDWDELHQVWQDLPPIRLPVPESQFEPYEAAVLRSRGSLTFDLEPMFDGRDGAAEASIREATARHRALLREQVLARIIVPRNPTTMEAKPGEWHPSHVLTLEDLRRFAAQLLISVRVNTSGAEADRSSVTPKTAANPMGAPWRREGLGIPERRALLLAKFRQLGGSVGKDGRLHSDTQALAVLVRLDGRQKDTLREQLQKAAKAEASSSEADAVPSTVSAWHPQPSSSATRKR